jgi:hypothetical protein
MSELNARLRKAIKHFWTTRTGQAERQGSATGRRDYGERGAVTGGKQMDGFITLTCEILVEAGIAEACVHCVRRRELPGYFRPEKQWDLLVIVDQQLLASIEFKSQIGPSFGNNYNNRTEEALGTATDLWAAYREGAMKPSQRPWLGYLMLLEETAGSTTPVRVSQPHFPVFQEFRGASYAKRYEILLTKLVRERLYDAACLLMTDRRTGLRGGFREPSLELSFQNFAASLLGKAIAHVKATKNE